MDSVVEIELLTSREGLLVAVTLRWALTHSFVFKFDLILVVT